MTVKTSNQTISILNKFCSCELFIHQKIPQKYSALQLSLEQQISIFDF